MNYITKLIGEDGFMYYGQQGLENIRVNFFSNLFTSSHPGTMESVVFQCSYFSY